MRQIGALAVLLARRPKTVRNRIAAVRQYHSPRHGSDSLCVRTESERPKAWSAVPLAPGDVKVPSLKIVAAGGGATRIQEPDVIVGCLRIRLAVQMRAKSGKRRRSLRSPRMTARSEAADRDRLRSRASSDTEIDMPRTLANVV